MTGIIIAPSTQLLDGDRVRVTMEGTIMHPTVVGRPFLTFPGRDDPFYQRVRVGLTDELRALCTVELIQPTGRPLDAGEKVLFGEGTNQTQCTVIHAAGTQAWINDGLEDFVADISTLSRGEGEAPIKVKV